MSNSDRPSHFEREQTDVGATEVLPDDVSSAGLPMPEAAERPRRTAVGTEPPPLPAPAIEPLPDSLVSRSRSYRFVLDEHGQPVEIGSGRFAKAYLGEEHWVESKTSYRRPVAIKALQCGVSREDQMRFQMEKEILERVQGHPHVVELLASGECDASGFVPPSLRGRIENDYMILELLDMSLEERLKGSRNKRR